MAQRVPAFTAYNLIAEVLTALVLTKLEVESEQFREESAEAGLRSASPVERLTELGKRRQQVGRDGVHHVFGVAFDHRHHRLHAVERLAL